MSDLWKAEIVNVIVLAAVLGSDVGSHRKIGRWRLLRPVVAAAVIVPLFLQTVTGSGNGLLLQVVGAAVGVVAGLAALSQLRVYPSDVSGSAVTRAGLGYVAVWVAVVGARAVFSFGSYHLYTDQLLRWLSVNQIPATALTDALVFMAIATVLTRTLGVAWLARRVNRQQPPTEMRSVPEGDHAWSTAS